MVQNLYYLAKKNNFNFFTSFCIEDRTFFPEYGTCINNILLVSFNRLMVVVSINNEIIIDAIGSAK